MVIMGSGDQTGQRGVSHLVGAVLLIGITMTAAVLIVVAGSGTLGDVNEQNNVEVAGQTFQQTDEAFQEFARQDRNRSRTVDLPSSMEGDVEVNDSSWNLTLNGNPQCTSGDRGMGELRYRGEDQTVGYEGGGIWKMTESGATMESPPKMTYEDGSLNLRFPNVTGEVTSSDRIALKSNVTRQDIQSNNLSRALYTNHNYEGGTGSMAIECAPDELQNATLWINDSHYASAWDRYFRNNYDEPLVTVETSQPDGPGDDVKVFFELGDVSDPEYNISDIEVSRTSNSGPVKVKPEITNSGGLKGTQTVRLEYTTISPGSLSGSDSDSVELRSGKSAKPELEIRSGHINPGDTYELEVLTDDRKSDNIKIKFENPAGIPDPSLQSHVPQNASTREDVKVNVTVNNAGGMTAYEDVEFKYRESGTSSWTKVGEDTVRVHPGKEGNATFDLPTDSPGLYEWKTTVAGEVEDGTFAVGSDPYFAIDETDGRAQVTTREEYELDATIRNVGDLNGTKEVEVIVERNDSSGWTRVEPWDPTRTIGGSVYEDNTTTLTYTKQFDREGEYRYTLTTGDETTSETFHVGPPKDPVLVVDSVEISPHPTTLNTNTEIEVTVRNVGPEQANQHINVSSEDGAVLLRERIAVDPDSTRTVEGAFETSDSRFDIGHNSLTVSTANASVPKTLMIQNKSERGDDHVKINRKVKAEIQVLGAELEGNFSYGGTNYVQHAKTEMWLDVENDSHSEREDLWQDEYDGDVNHPGAEKAMLQNSSAYTVTRTFGAGSEISLFARSYYCGDTRETGVVFEGIMPGGEDAEGLACTNGGERITISDDANSGNVVILTDGDEVPAFGAADYYQRDLQDMLGHRIDDDGTLSLGQDEFVFLYELSDENADPDEASGEGDPDYNDAVGLFRVVDVERSEHPPANFEIEGVDAPASASPGEDVQIAVTVNNTGGKAGSTSVLFDMQGQDTRTGETGTLEPGETETVHIDIPTDVESDSYQYTVVLGSNPQETHYGAITIGELQGPNFQITSLSAPSVAEEGTDPVAEVDVTNTGKKPGSTDIRLLEEPYYSSDEVDAESEQLEPGEEVTVSLELPSGTDETYYKVKTDGATTAQQRIYYGSASVSIENLAIGTSTYDRNDDLIERRNADAMSFKLENSGTIGDERNVTFEIRNESWSNTTWNVTQVGNGRIQPSSSYPAWVTVPTHITNEGYYEYTLTVKDDGTVKDSWDGELFVSKTVDAGGQQNSSSPISVDSNEVVISG